MYTELFKCELWMQEMSFLGHLISNRGLVVDSSKVDTKLQLETPKSVVEIKSFIGSVDYYKIFIKGFLKLALFLTELTRKG